MNLNRLIKTIGSLPVAVFLITALTAILILSTTMESFHGTPFAQANIYEAVWFDVFLGLVWVNIFCATLSRRPFKKRHVGFIITHIGILTLLIGTLLTRLTGAEGQMTLLEGEQWNRLQQKGSDLLASPEKGVAYQFRLPAKSSGRHQRLKVPGSDLQLYFERTAADVGTQLVVKNTSEIFNPAVQFTLESQRAGVRRQVWLVARDPENPFSDQLELGPAIFRLEYASGPSDEGAGSHEGHDHAGPAADAAQSDPARLVLYRQDGRPLESVELPVGSKKPFPIADGEFTLKKVRFLPYARVAENRLIDDPKSGKWNPAVEFTIMDAEGREEHHTRFALFPDFDSLHGKETPNVFHLKVELRAPSPEESAPAAARPELVFEAREEGDWTWRAVKSDGSEKTGTVQDGGSFETGWMDMKITVDRIAQRAVTTRVTDELSAGAAAPVSEGAGGEEAETGARVSYTDADGAVREDWVLTSKPLAIETAAGKWTLSLIDRSLPLPFTLQLRDFRKIDYPGTTNPASFESDVTLFDNAKGKKVKIERTIKMNEPLDYAGWRIFQSSYIQDPQFGEASVFTIAKNPGIGLTYAGLLILLTGVILLFYIKPFSSGDHVH